MKTRSIVQSSLFRLIAILLVFIGCKKDQIQPEKPRAEETTEQRNRPKVSTLEATNITYYSVRFSANILDTAGSALSEFGFVVDTLPDPTLERNLNKLVVPVQKSGLYSLIVTDVPGNKVFYYRAYAINESGPGYGKTLNFRSRDRKVHKGNVSLTTQQEVVNFGEQGFTDIDGGLNISGTVKSLEPLSKLTSIAYGLNVNGTTALENFSGLDSLEITDAAGFFHGVSFINNAALTSFEGLHHLYKTEGGLTIADNPKLKDLKGLRGLTYNHFGSLSIQNCASLTNLSGLEKFFLLDGSLIIKGNARMTDLSGLENLSEITRQVILSDNPALKSLKGLGKIQKLEALVSENNEKLEDFDGLSSLTTLSGLKIVKNSALRNLSAFRNIESLDYLSIEYNESLHDLSGLERLNIIQQKLTLNFNALQSLNGLNHLENAEMIDLIANDNLTDLRGLDNLQQINGDGFSISIALNANLTSLNGLNKLSFAAGSVQVFNNYKLTDFCALVPVVKNSKPGNFLTGGNAFNPNRTGILSRCK